MSRSRSNQKEGRNSRTGKGVTCTSDVCVETKKFNTGTKGSKLRSPGFIRRPKTLTIFNNDLPADVAARLRQEEYLSIDTETTGLDPIKNQLALVTIATTSGDVFVIKGPDQGSGMLASVLADGFSTKIFHHAFFDIQFIKSGIMVDVKGPVECTKIMMKMLYPGENSGLGSAIKKMLGITINKKIDHSMWKNDKLTARQKEYVAGDVLFLYPLVKELKRQARFGTLRLYADAILAMRLKAKLEVEGYIDLLSYNQAAKDETISIRTWWNKKQATSPMYDIMQMGDKSCSKVPPVS